MAAAGFSQRAGKRTLQLDFATLTPYIGPPVQRQEELEPIKIWTSPAGKTLVDFGQNLVGWVRLRAPAGSTITLRHAERSWSTTNWVPGRYGPRGHRPLHPQRR